MSRHDLGLYAAVVLLWGSSWIAIHFQLGVVSPEVSLFWRFGSACLGTAAWAMLSGATLRLPAAAHAICLGVGLCLFGLNFMAFYYGGLLVPSGLLAVVFSLASIFNIAIGAAVFGNPVDRRLVVGGLLGALGVAGMYGPQIAGQGLGGGAILGLVLCIGGTVLFTCGNLLATLAQRRKIPVLSLTAWGMVYGTVLLGGLALLRGKPFIIEWTVPYLGGLAFLSIGSSILGFAAYMRLLRRIGAARASYTTVLFPVVALAFSTVLEGFRWSWPSLLGLALVLCGNLLVLTPAQAWRRPFSRR